MYCNMFVGFMHRNKKPPLIAKVTALMGSYYGIDIIYFRPRDIDIANKVVKGRMYKNNKWISIKKKLPLLVDPASRCFKKDTIEIMNFLRENTVLTFDKINTPNKDKLQRELLKDSRFAHIVIPTIKMDSFESLERFLNKYSSIIIKPLFGKQGMDLYSLHMKDSTYVLRSEKGEKTLDYDGLHKYYKNVFTKKDTFYKSLLNPKQSKVTHLIVV